MSSVPIPLCLYYNSFLYLLHSGDLGNHSVHDRDLSVPRMGLRVMRTLDVRNPIGGACPDTRRETRRPALLDEFLGCLLCLWVTVNVCHVLPLSGVGRDIITPTNPVYTQEFCSERSMYS